MNTEQIREDGDSLCVLDSGALQRMTANRQLLTTYQEFDVPETIKLGDWHTEKIAMKINKNKEYIPTISDEVPFVPKLACNVFRIRTVRQKGYIVQFGHSCCWKKGSNSNVRGRGHLVYRMYKLISDVEAQTKSYEIKRPQVKILINWIYGIKDEEQSLQKCQFLRTRQAKRL